jgi:peptide/nickel transport system substrate-binding protein
MPKEVVAAGPGNWKNANGTGPFQLQEYVQGNSLIFTKNPVYWDKEKIAGVEYKLPFVDKITYRSSRTSHLRHRAAHRQARRAGVRALEPCRRDEEERPKLQWTSTWPTAAVHRAAHGPEAL